MASEFFLNLYHLPTRLTKKSSNQLVVKVLATNVLLKLANKV